MSPSIFKNRKFGKFNNWSSIDLILWHLVTKVSLSLNQTLSHPPSHYGIMTMVRIKMLVQTCLCWCFTNSLTSSSLVHIIRRGNIVRRIINHLNLIYLYARHDHVVLNRLDLTLHVYSYTCRTTISAVVISTHAQNRSFGHADKHRYTSIGSDKLTQHAGPSYISLERS